MSGQVQAAWIGLAGVLSGVIVGAICTAAVAFAKDMLFRRYHVRRDVAIKYMVDRLRVYEELYSSLDQTYYVTGGEQRKLIIYCREQCAKNYGHTEERVRQGVGNLVKYCVADRPIREEERDELMETLRAKMDAIKRSIEANM